MLRFDHMPSDFDPQFLFLGDGEDLSGLTQLLRDFSDEPRVIDVREAMPGTGGRARLSLVPAEGPDARYGMRETPEHNHYAWTLNAWQAGQIAARIHALTANQVKSGNEIFEVGLEGEIPVRVSRGEFTDNFLTPRHHLDPDYQESS